MISTKFPEQLIEPFIFPISVTFNIFRLRFSFFIVKWWFMFGLTIDDWWKITLIRFASSLCCVWVLSFWFWLSSIFHIEAVLNTQLNFCHIRRSMYIYVCVWVWASVWVCVCAKEIGIWLCFACHSTVLIPNNFRALYLLLIFPNTERWCLITILWALANPALLEN